MVTAEQLEQRRAAVARSPDLAALLAHLAARAAPVLAQTPAIPEHKALLSVDGGVCPRDGAPLTFDPWSPLEHRCSRCGAAARGVRHERHWARFQHLWLAERTVELAALGALGGHAAAAAKARELLGAYAERYPRYPNRDNTLGPSRLFFSTYLESIWVLNYVGAAMLLAAADALDEATGRAVAQVADEAANLIGEFDEGFSNRQTWNAAALTAIAVWFEDEDLARKAIQGPTGLVGHLEGYRADGMWYEGENYHLFALRGLLTGAGWARLAGFDLFAEAPLRERVLAALRAPAASALPDLTFPARKDARFGVALAQPMYLELWEVGAGMAAVDGAVPEDLASWLAALYATPAPHPELFDSYLHDFPAAAARTAAGPASRRRLSWWALLEMPPELAPAPAWQPGSVLLRNQGLAVLRAGDRYVSLECGPLGGGHGHADRLHVTVHAGGVHWLPDWGTASYVSRDLFWYRSGLAHNAPVVDGGVGARRNATCEWFDIADEWSWVGGRAGPVTRTVVAGPAYLLDVVDAVGRDECVLELPWHFAASAEPAGAGRWEPADLASDVVTDVERYVASGGASPARFTFESDGARLAVQLWFRGELLRAVGPGRPGGGAPAPFYVLRGRGASVRCVAVIEPYRSAPTVLDVRVTGDLIEVETRAGLHRHRAEPTGWSVEHAAGRVTLGGRVEAEPPTRPFLDLQPATRAAGVAWLVDQPPPLDGTPTGFDPSEPLRLELEDQYRRAEEPYAGPDEFSAYAYVAWDADALYLAAHVVKPDPTFRPPDAPPLLLDNERDEIHSDGLQLYVRVGEEPDAPVAGFLVVPHPDGTLGVHAVAGTDADPAAVRGAWRAADDGYTITLACRWPSDARPRPGGRLGFDLLVNEMHAGRERRAGQLVWTGGHGWVWLWGDRQDSGRLGVLELVG